MSTFYKRLRESEADFEIDNAASFQSPCPFYAPEPVAPESKYATSMSMGSDSTPSFVGAGTPKSG